MQFRIWVNILCISALFRRNYRLLWWFEKIILESLSLVGYSIYDIINGTNIQY